eukprot:scaffold152505_cov33-Tisochrysis_lutea.AAC.4
MATAANASLVAMSWNGSSGGTYMWHMIEHDVLDRCAYASACWCLGLGWWSDWRPQCAPLLCIVRAACTG